ncbi:antibiotic biosynthesis monooxygenase [Cohnella sp. CIP 111063]|jgi:heme oxygenase (staphylobilin-producing)|uniref:antibiotic biosynthesis monooxygenase n=1 Tax=unclassified Cohnella TaxID=2636738 RepID=UPI000B8BB970|nr:MULTISPECIES: antibiotic biosynthesis monooxygenase [unclassified Cohnella]OXS59929.1 antibiotic biosynthesis monooxygenase [Cohnella sp. CIP 111063]PRX72739.1 heme oxygenase (staphylobilin-producing) [Cohnella sp. SGD-V74]
MLIQTRTIAVQKGNADKVVERFSQEGVLDEREGLIDITVMTNKRSKDIDEVVVIIRWESEEAWKNWEKSPEHIQGHRNSKGQTPPDYVISTTVNMYDVNKVRTGKFGQ